jgi:hypothetical protein
MDYRVILTMNGEFKQTLYKCKTRNTCFVHYHRIKDENKVFFPRKHVNSHGIVPVEYTMYIVKEREEDDINRTIRDDFGRLIEEPPLFNKWTILDSAPYDFEETFWLYGYDPRKDRKTIHDIIKKLMLGAYKKTMLKQIIVVHNKLIIYNEDQFDMVLCKCKKDAQRLHHALSKATRSNKIKSLLFMGTATPATVSYMYDIIMEHTGWPIQKIWRTSTRP